MVLNLKQLFLVEGDRIDFSYDIDLSDFELSGVRFFKSPVKISGYVFNRASIVTINYNASFTFNYNCDRCLKAVTRDCSQDYSHVLVNELCNEDSDSLYAIEHFLLDLDELAVADIVINLPLKFLCRDDCKGLCPKCGINLNDGKCDCERNQIDSRLEALTKLLN